MCLKRNNFQRCQTCFKRLESNAFINNISDNPWYFPDNRIKHEQLMHNCRALRHVDFEGIINIFTNILRVNLSWHGDVIWQHKSRSTLSQVVVRCPTVPNHQLNQCWLIIGEVLCHSPDICKMLKIYNLDMSLKMTNIQLHDHLPGFKGLKVKGDSTTFHVNWSTRLAPIPQ